VTYLSYVDEALHSCPLHDFSAGQRGAVAEAGWVGGSLAVAEAGWAGGSLAACCSSPGTPQEWWSLALAGSCLAPLQSTKTPFSSFIYFKFYVF
jgi:hypothetical protein